MVSAYSSKYIHKAKLKFIRYIWIHLKSFHITFGQTVGITFPLITNETRFQKSGHKESISKYPLKLHFLNTELYNQKLKVNVRGVGTHPSSQHQKRQGWWVYEFESRQGYMVRPFLCLSSCHHYKNQQQQQKTAIKKTIPLKVVTHTYSYKRTKRTLKPEFKILKLDIEW